MRRELIMAGNRIDLLDQAFDDHPSLSASLEDFEHHEDPSPLLPLPSHHSGFKSDSSETGADTNPDEPWSPPGWRNQGAGNSWYRHQPYQHPIPHLKPPHTASRSRETSPAYENYESARESAKDDYDITIPANIPLPRGSLSPVKERSASPVPFQEAEQQQGFGKTYEAPEAPEEQAPPSDPNNYIRFAVRAEVQHRTEPIEAAFSWLRGYLDSIAKSWSSLSSSLMFLALAYMIIRIITRTPTSPPVPDLVKVAGLARNFEPLLLYSENGARQIGDLQETSVAVWDLGESVRSANMTSGPLIVEELDQLSESLKTLSIELARFFADVDGDIDGILIVMEWAKRELSVLPTLPLSSLSSAFTNIHTLLCRVGVLESRSTGLPTTLGAIFTDLFGATDSQRTRQTLHRTFNEFLAVLEESINSELTRSTALFTLFESIDRQFLNLQRSVIRESDTQERLEGEFLSSLWVRIMGANASLLRKYEKNKQLLSNVRAKTTSNKSLLVEHNGKLVMLKGNLERLRRQLVSPLVRRDDGSTVGVEEQIRGLEGTYIHLRRTRERQKERMLEGIYGATSGRGRVVIGRDDGPSGGVEIEGR